MQPARNTGNARNLLAVNNIFNSLKLKLLFFSIPRPAWHPQNSPCPTMSCFGGFTRGWRVECLLCDLFSVCSSRQGRTGKTGPHLPTSTAFPLPFSPSSSFHLQQPSILPNSTKQLTQSEPLPSWVRQSAWSSSLPRTQLYFR